MINLDTHINKTTDFMLFGEMVKVQELTTGMFKEITSVSKLTDTDEIFDAQLDLAVKILNNNTSGKKYTLPQIKTLPLKVINVLITTMTKSAQDTTQDPN